jgi:hypothetical protein
MSWLSSAMFPEDSEPFPRTMFRCSTCNRLRQENVSRLTLLLHPDTIVCDGCRSHDRRNDLRIFFEEFTSIGELGFVSATSVIRPADPT